MNIPKAIIMFIVAILATVGLLSIIYSQTRSSTSHAIQHPEPVALNTRIVYVVRHAETDPSAGDNPLLTELGQSRAVRLATMLADQKLAGIFVTDTARSVQTATPIASTMGIEPTKYAPTDAQALIASINQLPKNQPALVVAHSNTVPMIIEALTGLAMDDLHHDEFDRFFAIVLNHDAFVEIVELRY